MSLTRIHSAGFRRCLWAAASVACAAGPAQAGVSLLVVDRTAGKLWRLTDLDNSNTIEPGEIFVWFDGTNAAGTPAFITPFAFAVRPIDNAVLVGDANSANRSLYLIKDADRSGSAMGMTESRVVLTGANASGATITAPSGVAFFPGFDPGYVNAGAGSNPDAIYRLHEIVADGTYQDAGEVSPWVTNWATYGSGNTPFSPQEIVFDAAGVGYVRNSSSGAPGHSVWRFRDANGNGRADDPGEMTLWFDNTNAAGITMGAGFAMELDLARPRTIYTNHLLSLGGGVNRKQIVRLSDSNNDGNANGPNESVAVYSTDEAGLTIQDVVSLPNGDLYFTDVSSSPGGKRIFRLHDLGADGLFLDPGERTEFLTQATAAAAGILDNRYLGWLRDISACAADFNNSGDLSVQDIFDFLNAWFNTDPRADFNNVGGLNVQDIFDFLNAWFAGCA
ncbi:MAG TPA: GC-type dockerin domain-anchored protein [Phycisphaerales bacterium]|nr:GC-type dockerin domain-anchored protein [Phycisphaerales bacterium]